MKDVLLHILTVALFLFSPLRLQSQVESFSAINIHGLNSYANEGAQDFRFTIYSLSEELLWMEEHSSVNIIQEKSYQMMLGLGVKTGGSVVDFNMINWMNVSRVELWRTGSTDVLLAELSPLAQVFAFHSLKLNSVPVVVDLADVNPPEISGYLLKYAGSDFNISEDILGDTVVFSFTAGTASFADTANVGIIDQGVADSSVFAFKADTVGYADFIDGVMNADTVAFSDSAYLVFSAVNNWSIEGNDDIGPDQFLGTINSEEFSFGTNGVDRLNFGVDGSVNNFGASNGFAIQGNEGVLMRPGVGPESTLLDGTYTFYSGEKRAWGMSYSSVPRSLDTTMALYSFHFGKDVASPGTYTAVFGYECSADSSLSGGVMSEPNASIVFGRESKVSRICVAIGKNARADFYRNVAIGTDVTANIGSAAIAVGTNISSTGATAWAVGSNLNVNGNFSSALGNNSTSDGYQGSFVWADNSSLFTLANTANQQFMVRAAGGVVFYSSSDMSTGVILSAGDGAWTMVSDREKKENICLVDESNLEELFLNLPVYEWQYISQSRRYIGPMAQDFYQNVKVGEKETHINMLDADGLVLSGIDAVNNRLNTLDMTDEIQELGDSLDEEIEAQDELENRIKKLYEKLDN